MKLEEFAAGCTTTIIRSGGLCVGCEVRHVETGASTLYEDLGGSNAETLKSGAVEKLYGEVFPAEWKKLQRKKDKGGGGTEESKVETGTE